MLLPGGGHLERIVAHAGPSNLWVNEDTHNLDDGIGDILTRQ